MVQQPMFLYVEDDPLSREIMEMMLRNLGYTRITLLESSQDVMQRIEELPSVPDVICLDIHMQPHNGFEMLEALRQRPTFASKSIIAVTASVMNEEVERLKAAGFDGAIGKPLDFENFANLIGRVLAGEKVWHII
jgi:two-component system cell cycle response regulator DivK